MPTSPQRVEVVSRRRRRQRRAGVRGATHRTAQAFRRAIRPRRQYAGYTRGRLRAFKAGERGMDKEGKDVNGKIMAQIAARMNEQAIAAAAQYAAGLH